MDEFDFTCRNQILNLIERADDNFETKNLISYFSSLKSQRIPMFLDNIDIEKVFKWKLRSQFGRQKILRQSNTDEVIQKVTSLAFGIEHTDNDYEIELKLKILSSLRGVEIPVASAILTLVYPDKFAVIDFRVWKQLFKVKKSSYTTKDYLKYYQKAKYLSEKYNLSLQQIDMAIWQYDKETNPS